MFPLPPSWDPLPGGPPIPLVPLVGIGWPLVLVGLVALLAAAAILGIDLTRNRARRRQTQPSERSAVRSDTVIDIGRTTAPRAVAGGRR